MSAVPRAHNRGDPSLLHHVGVRIYEEERKKVEDLQQDDITPDYDTNMMIVRFFFVGHIGWSVGVCVYRSCSPPMCSSFGWWSVTV